MKLINFLAFQLGWFGCLLTVRKDDASFGIGIVAAIVLLHLVMTLDSRREALVILVTALVGAVVDGLNVGLGVFDVRPAGVAPWLPPTWLIAVWALFATTLNGSLSWMQGKYLLAALFGAVLGPASYLAGARLTKSQISFPIPDQVGAFLEWSPERVWDWSSGRSIWILAVEWAVVFPLLLLMARKLRPVWAESSD